MHFNTNCFDFIVVGNLKWGFGLILDRFDSALLFGGKHAFQQCTTKSQATKNDLDRQQWWKLLRALYDPIESI